jgi:hypothetical protein
MTAATDSRAVRWAVALGIVFLPWMTLAAAGCASTSRTGTTTPGTATPGTTTPGTATPGTELAPDTDLASGTGALLAARDAPLRDLGSWPFAADSPWNTPIGPGALLEPVDGPRTIAVRNADVPAVVNAGRYSMPVHRALESDPMLSVFDRGRGGAVVTFRAPTGAVPADGEDRHLVIIDPTGRWADEMWAVDGTLESQQVEVGYHVRTDLAGAGIDGGVRAYGGSALGGLIRSWELEFGEIGHVLALALTNDQLVTGPVWPATREDGDAPSSYRGVIPMGTAVVLDPSVDIATLGLSRGGTILARALQHHGAFVVDRAGAFAFYAEPKLDDTPVLDEMKDDLPEIRRHLRIVVEHRTGATR